MKLIQYQKEANKLPKIPNKVGGESGYLLLALVQDNSEIYAAFTNYLQDNLWIERWVAPNIIGRMFCVEELERIEDDEEFEAVRAYLAKEKII